MAPRGSGSDESKSNQRLSNREAAKRCRTKKQERVRELIREDARLKEENESLGQRIEAETQEHVDLESDNKVQRARLGELTGRLKWLNSALQVTGLAIDIDQEILVASPEPGSVCP
ncbi:bZIP transcription factor 53-like [Salvia divinorum]|uniref:BZIP transcription factor 53-like n=1 Tax=Salvia divinorum TaxID=28513 RepID=A0ABD1G5F5_SALDI